MKPHTLNGGESPKGYVFEFAGHGAFAPEGRVHMLPEEIAAHNAKLASEELAQIAAGFPTVVYPAGDTLGSPVRLWDGTHAGTIRRVSFSRTGFNCRLVYRITWSDMSGRLWYGQGLGSGRSLVSRRMSKLVK